MLMDVMTGFLFVGVVVVGVVVVGDVGVLVPLSDPPHADKPRITSATTENLTKKRTTASFQADDDGQGRRRDEEHAIVGRFRENACVLGSGDQTRFVR
jgi:hypothetical protein